MNISKIMKKKIKSWSDKNHKSTEINDSSDFEIMHLVPKLALDPKVASFISCGLCFLIEF